VAALWHRRVTWWNDPSRVVVVEHSLPPRRATADQLLDSSTGTDLLDVSADGKWRHAHRFVGFDGGEEQPLPTGDGDADVRDVGVALTKVLLCIWC
jgi:hypothetical protein